MVVRLGSIGLLLLALLVGSGATARAECPAGAASLRQARAAALWLCRQVAASEPGLLGWRGCLAEAREEAQASSRAYEVERAVSEQRESLRSEIAARVESAVERTVAPATTVEPREGAPNCQTEREERDGTVRQTIRCAESRVQVVSSPSGTLSISQVQSQSSVTAITSTSSSGAD